MGQAVTGWGADWTREGLVSRAVELAELGFGIVRVYRPLSAEQCSCGNPHDGKGDNPDAKSIGKHPIGHDWQKRAVRDPERVRTMMNNPGNQSYGIIPPPGTFEWDIDGSAPARIAELSRTLGPLPETRRHASGNGEHAFYRWPSDVPGGSGNLYGIVTRWAPGGQVIGPGSVHAATGKLYRVVSDTPIVELPRAWAEAATSWSNDTHTAQDRAEPGDQDWTIPEGLRHPFIVRSAARLRNVGLREGGLGDALASLNSERCASELPAKEIADITRDYSKKPGRPPGVTITGADGPGRDADPTPNSFPEPEDRGTATLSALGGVEYVEDLIRPGRIVVVAAEEGSGKSYAIGGELAVRVAAAGGSFAGTWPILRTGPVLNVSEMHADDDYGREATVLASLGLERSALTERLYRLPLMTAAGGEPALTVPVWREWVTNWLRDHGALLLIVDTATGATQVDPWGRDIQAVFAGLRVMLAVYPDLAIVLLIHLKKPQGRGERRISDVLGEWGRWCDVVILMENDGNGLTRARLTVRKRVRHERRIVVTKAGGLLIDPQDLDEAKSTKVPLEAVLAAIEAAPGITYAELGGAVGVSDATASRYVAALGDKVDAVKGTGRSGPEAKWRIYAVSSSPHVSSREGWGDSEETPAAVEGSPRQESPHLLTTYVGEETLGEETPAAPIALSEASRRTFGDDLEAGPQGSGRPVA